MTLVNTETGEIFEPLNRTDAERLTTRIRLRLDTIADNYTAVMPLIREAIEREAHRALGYRSVGDYVSKCFGDALSRLGVDVRREVVRELTEAGMSTRAIAPVVGVNNATVHRDLARVASATPDPEPEPTPEPCVRPQPVVTGIDGKTYTRPTPVKPRRKPLTDTARDAGWDLRKSAERLQRIADDDRFGANKDEVAAHLRGHLTYAIEVLADLLDRIDN